MFIFRILRRLVELFVLVLVAYYVISGIQVVTSSRAPGAVGTGPDEPVVAVVASGPSAGTAPLSADFAARLDHAISLRSAHRAPRIVVLANSARQAANADSYLVHHGASEATVASVVGSDTPAAFVGFAAKDPGHRAIVVADTWDTLLVTHLASAAGLTVAVSPAVPPDDGTFNEISSVAGQAAAVGWGRIAGWDKTGFVAG